ncbi:hypothetical protein TNCV_2007351 [Trichonephila clavipes]|nr:hypothetical protein TNCV_2007351 [Trichonephila clavipes]
MRPARKTRIRFDKKKRKRGSFSVICSGRLGNRAVSHPDDFQRMTHGFSSERVERTEGFVAPRNGTAPLIFFLSPFPDKPLSRLV